MNPMCVKLAGQNRRIPRQAISSTKKRHEAHVTQIHPGICRIKMKRGSLQLAQRTQYRIYFSCV